MLLVQGASGAQMTPHAARGFPRERKCAPSNAIAHGQVQQECNRLRAEGRHLHRQGRQWWRSSGCVTCTTLQRQSSCRHWSLRCNARRCDCAITPQTVAHAHTNCTFMRLTIRYSIAMDASQYTCDQVHLTCWKMVNWLEQLADDVPVQSCSPIKKC